MTSARLSLTLWPIAFVILSCGKATAPEAATVAATSSAVPPLAISGLTASAYVSEAAAIDLFAIRSAKLALTRSTSLRVRQFAQSEISGHDGLAAQLSFAGRRLNLLPSAELPAPYQTMLDMLSASPNFDATYKAQEIAVHQRSLALHRAYAVRGASPTLRPVAAELAPLVERHLRWLGYL